MGSFPASRPPVTKSTNAFAAPVGSTGENTVSARRHGGSGGRTTQFSRPAHHMRRRRRDADRVGEAFLTLTGRGLHQRWGPGRARQVIGR